MVQGFPLRSEQGRWHILYVAPQSWLLHKLPMASTVPFLALAKAHMEVLAPACNLFVSAGLPSVLGDIPAAVWECARIPAIPASWYWQAWPCDRRLQQQMGWEPSRGLWPSPWLRAGPALKIKQVLQSFLFSQAWWLSSSAKQPPFVQKCPCVKVLPWLLGHFQPDSVR